MKTIEKDEIFKNVNEFLRTKGIELRDGSYSETIRKSCRIVADVINLGQSGIDKARTGIDKTLDQVRQTIHEKTAPKTKATAKGVETAVSPPTSSVSATLEQTAPPDKAVGPKAKAGRRPRKRPVRTQPGPRKQGKPEAKRS